MLIVLGGLAALPKEPYESAADRRRQRVAALPLHHAAADLALHHGGGDHPHHRCAEELRRHLSRSRRAARARRRRRSTSISTAWPSPTTISATARPSPSSSSPHHRAAVPRHAASSPAHEVDGTGRRHENGSLAQRIGFFLRGPRPGLAGHPVLSLDAVALAEDTRSTTLPFRRSSSRTRFDAGRTIVDVFDIEQFRPVLLNSMIVTGSARRSGSWLACPPATASPA